MTVGELIKRLLDYPLHHEVLIARDEEWNGIRRMHEIDPVEWDYIDQEPRQPFEEGWTEDNAIVLT